MLTLAIQPWLVSVLVAVFLFCCVVLILTVLIQRPQGGGLSGAFGAGGGAGQTAFGTKTGDALTIATITMFVIFLGLAIGLNFATRPTAITPAQPSITPVQGGTAVGEEAADDAGTDETGAAEETDAVDLVVPPADGAEPAPATDAGEAGAEAPPGGEAAPAEGAEEPGAGEGAP